MTPEGIFSAVNMTALVGWLLLLATPWSPVWTQRISGRLIPVVLAVGYTAILMIYWSSGEGGFDSLASVMKLFTRPELVLAGWIHYLAFDLFVGAWECRVASDECIPFWLVIPCLVLTFLFGPAGLLLFIAIRQIRRTQRAARLEA